MIAALGRSAGPATAGLLCLLVSAALPAAAQGPPAQRVPVAPVVARELPITMRLIATVLPDRSSIVASEVSGIVEALLIDEGERVTAGQPLARLDPGATEFLHAEAEAQLEALRARLEELEAGTRREVLEQWQAQVGQAEAMVQKWDFERQRVYRLFEEKQSNAKEKTDTDAEYTAAAQRLAQMKAQLEEARNGPRKEVLARARAEVAAQEAIVRRLARDLAKTEIVAPFDGYVASKRTELGQWVTAGGPVCELLAIDTVRIRANAPAPATPFARPGALASVDYSELGGRKSAEISRLIPQAAEAARTFPIEIDLENPDARLLPGMLIWTEVPAGPVGMRLMAPLDALVANGTARQVFVVRDGENGAKMAIPTPVQTGIQFAGEIEIISEAIRPGDLLVTRGNERLFGPTPVIPMLPDGLAPESAPRERAAAPEAASAAGARE